MITFKHSKEDAARFFRSLSLADLRARFNFKSTFKDITSYMNVSDKIKYLCAYEDGKTIGVLDYHAIGNVGTEVMHEISIAVTKKGTATVLLNEYRKHCPKTITVGCVNGGSFAGIRFAIKHMDIVSLTPVTVLANNAGKNSRLSTPAAREILFLNSILLSKRMDDYETKRSELLQFLTPEYVLCVAAARIKLSMDAIAIKLENALFSKAIVDLAKSMQLSKEKVAQIAGVLGVKQ